MRSVLVEDVLFGWNELEYMEKVELCEMFSIKVVNKVPQVEHLTNDQLQRLLLIMFEML